MQKHRAAPHPVRKENKGHKGKPDHRGRKVCKDRKALKVTPGLPVPMALR
jgi:hypothetical protein